MKKFIALLFLTVSFSVYAQAPNTDGAVITFEKDVVDFGTVTQGSEQVRTFNFTNTGTAPLIISSIKGQCGCTTISDSWPKEAIAPGGTGSFQVTYDTKRGVGKFDKKIIITSNATNPVTEVRITGEVVAGQ